jgi:hypothetical protein
MDRSAPRADIARATRMTRNRRRATRHFCDAAIALAVELREHVQQLENDEAAGEKEGLPDGVDSDQLMRELEDFLRKQRESSGGAGSRRAGYLSSIPK